LKQFGTKPFPYIETVGRVLPELNEQLVTLTPLVVHNIRVYCLNLDPIQSELCIFTYTLSDKLSTFDVNLFMDEASMNTTLFFRYLSVNDSLELFRTFVEYSEQTLPVMLPLLFLHSYATKDYSNFLVILKDFSFSKTTKFNNFCPQ